MKLLSGLKSADFIANASHFVICNILKYHIFSFVEREGSIHKRFWLKIYFTLDGKISSYIYNETKR